MRDGISSGGAGATPEALRRAELELAGHELFGEPQRALRAVADLYEFDVELLQDGTPQGRELVEALASADRQTRLLVLTSTTVRAGINDLVARLKGQTPVSCVAAPDILAAAAAAVRRRHDRPLECSESVMVHRSDLRSTWLYQPTGTPIDTALLELCRAELVYGSGADDLVLRTPPVSIIEVILQGASLLMQLLPAIAEAVLPHAGMVALIDVADAGRWDEPTRPGLFESGSKDSVPATIFLTPNALRSRWTVAEALLHEACHQKYFDLVATRSIHRAGYSSAGSRTLTAVWNRSLPGNSNRWPMDRAFIAFHAYVHIALLYQAAMARQSDLEPPQAPPHGETLVAGARRCLDRARYLGNGLRTQLLEELGTQGAQLLDWLVAIMDSRLDPDPPAEAELCERLSIAVHS